MIAGFAISSTNSQFQNGCDAPGRIMYPIDSVMDSEFYWHTDAVKLYILVR
jgi:hypothetical protein